MRGNIENKKKADHSLQIPELGIFCVFNWCTRQCMVVELRLQIAVLWRNY